MALDILGRFFLFFTSAFFIIPVSTLGYWFYRKEVFGKLIFLILFSIIFNLYLKSIWQEPRPAWLPGDSWAFPSGHMKFTLCFYGWLAFEYRKKWLSVSAALIMLGVGWALVHFRYHTPRDVLASVGFGGLTLIAYYFFLKISFIKKNLPLAGLVLSPLTALFIYLIPKYFSYVYEAQGQLMGFSLGWFLWDKYCPAELTKGEKIMNVILSFLGAGVFIGLGFMVPKTPILVLALSFLAGLSISFPGFGVFCRKREACTSKLS